MGVWSISMVQCGSPAAIQVSRRGIRVGKWKRVFPKGWILRRKCSPAGLFLFAGDRHKEAKVLLVKEKIVTIDKGFFMLQWKTLARFQLQFMGGIGSQDISLMQPEGNFMDAQIAGRFVKR